MSASALWSTVAREYPEYCSADGGHFEGPWRSGPLKIKHLRAKARSHFFVRASAQRIQVHALDAGHQSIKKFALQLFTS